MNLGDLWARTARHRPWWITGLIVVVLVIAVFLYGLASMLGAIGRAVHKPAVKPDQVTMEAVDADKRDEAMVALFSKRCMRKYLTAVTGTDLSDCFTVPSELREFSGFAATVSDLDAYAPQLTYRDSEISYWSVMVSATVKEFNAPAASWQAYWLSVSLPVDGGPRAIVMPDTRATALPGGVDLELLSARDVAERSPLYTQVQGFLRAYLCGPPGPAVGASPCGADMTTYAANDSGLSTLGRLYTDLSIKSMKADIPADDAPAPGEQAHVLVTLVGSDGTGGKKPMQYPLLAVEAAGKWAISAIEDLPAVTGRMLPPGER
ncbi:hypothetical protein PP613_23605 [Mycobacteroides abscessus]|nr:hypothetical protein [Mycobacteroides abscessus]MDM2412330.1 hypothetical protein [Mycobacteroides abscessus]